MQDSLDPNPRHYPNFNLFFTRALKPGARPIANAQFDIACPADGFICQLGRIHGDQLFQAKKFTFSLDALLGSAEQAKLFQDGNFANIYLAPKNYHRVHMPIAGKLKSMTFIPGRLFSVNPATVNHVPHLFTRNERVICLFDSEAGPLAVILVGAMLVASIETVWAGVIAPAKQQKIQHWDYSAQNIYLNRGEEMGRFQMGSTVIVLFAKDKAAWLPNLHAEMPVQLGQLLGNFDNQ